MTSHNRFSDEMYKNWLKTTMSLQLLRSGLQNFLENETETFHRSLQDKLKGTICESKCDFKKQQQNPWQMKPPLCQACQRWKDEISAYNKNKGLVYWNNSKPYLWSSKKWEVAKVYMPRGNRDHGTLDQFDISAVLNLMTFCTHFENFVKDQVIKEVTSVRNQMMHSPDMKVTEEDMGKHLNKIQELIRRLQNQIPELKEVGEEVSQLQKTELNVMLEGQENSADARKADVIRNLLNVQKMQDLEQQVLKEKIETLAFRLEEDKGLANTEFLGMKEFLDQNKDLLDQLGPQVKKLNVIQEKVDQHDVQLNVLNEKVDHLEKITNEPVLYADVVKYKNHLLEEARKNKWQDPVFTEIRKPQGYIGQVVVNGQTFTGEHVFPKVKAAHQDVSKIALEQLKMRSTGMEEDSLSLHHTDQSETSASKAPVYFCSVTVDLNTEIASSEGHYGKEEAIQSAYKTLASKFGMKVSEIGTSYKLAVQEYFSNSGFQQPEEVLHTGPDEKVYCKLKLCGSFTFQGKEGASKKKLAEQQAARVALHQLSGVLGDIPLTGENYKGALKELMDAKSLQHPTYSSTCNHTNERGGTGEDSNPAPVKPIVQPSESHLAQYSDPDNTELQPIETASQVTNTATPIQTQECTVSSGNPTYFAAVKVSVNTVQEGPVTDSRDNAVQQAYRSLEKALSLVDTAAGSTTDSARQRVCDFFSIAECEPPTECLSCTEEQFRCNLKICGDMTFQNPEAMSKKQQAEQAAAKEALVRLAGVLGWDLAGTNGNYKGKLQELLAKQGLKPSYLPVARTRDTEMSSRGAEPESRGAGDPTPEAGVSGNRATTSVMPPADSSQLPPDRKVPRVEFPEIVTALRMLGLQPPSVKCGQCTMDKRFELRVEIHLASYIFKNEHGYNSKRDATRNTYLVFGQATGICKPSTEESQSKEQVKQYFSQKSFNLPIEEFVEKDKKFYCSLKVESCSFSYEGQGPSEETARQEASRKALSQLGPLFGFDLAARVISSEEAEEKLNLMLESGHQKLPVFHKDFTRHRATVELLLNALTLESKGHNNKKLARSQLSARILGLLGEEETEMSNNVNVRNRVDDWFKKKGFSPPVFEDTEGVLGAKATFSASITCQSDWQPTWEDAVERLKKEVQTRFQNLAEESADGGLSAWNV